MQVWQTTPPGEGVCSRWSKQPAANIVLTAQQQTRGEREGGGISESMILAKMLFMSNQRMRGDLLLG